jgi:hypothetical protein
MALLAIVEFRHFTVILKMYAFVHQRALTPRKTALKKNEKGNATFKIFQA